MKIKLLKWQEVLPIRHAVLWPSKPPLFCKVEGDETALHYGVYLGEQLTSVASIYIDDSYEGITKSARLRKFATLVKYQGRGIGRELIINIICELKKSGVKYFWCDARTTAIGFYQQFNMVKQGVVFQRSGIDYVKMSVELI